MNNRNDKNIIDQYYFALPTILNDKSSNSEISTSLRINIFDGLFFIIVWICVWDIIENTISLYVPDDSYKKRIYLYSIILIISIVIYLLYKIF